MGVPAHVVGRERELKSIARFLDNVPKGPTALLMEGEAGIGKTTLWQACVEQARALGARVLTARAGGSEAKLSLAALSDLLEPVVDDALPTLPDPQRAALEAALMRRRSTRPSLDRRAVAVAALSVLRSAATDHPVVIAIDDLQWVDASSGRVLEFCLRRLAEAPVGLLASVRLGTGSPMPGLMERALVAERVDRVTLGPMRSEELRLVIRARLGADLPHPLIPRVNEAAAGNPFYAIEISREILRRGAPRPGEALPVPDDLADLLGGRLTALPRASRKILFVAASMSRPTLAVVRSASGLGARAGSALTTAEAAGLVSVEGDAIRFSHPLLASAAYASMTAEERTKVHRGLADHVDDPEERARHLALASEGPDPLVAQALDEAAEHARGRGAPDAAAELAELARRLTPPREAGALRMRTVHAAQHNFDAGDVVKAMALFEEAIGSASPGLDRARIRFLLASHSWMDLRQVGTFCELAISEAEGDEDLLAGAREHLAWVAIYRGDLAAASRHARASLAHARSTASLATRADSLATLGMVEFLSGRPADALMSEAERLHDLTATRAGGLETAVYTSVRTNHGLQLLWAGELDAARTTLRQELHGLEERGRYLVRDEILAYLSEVGCRAGDWATAARYAEEAHEIGLESGRVVGSGHHLFHRALAAALRGDVEMARSDAEEGLRISTANDDPFYTSENRWVLGLLELSRSNPTGALEHLEPVLAYLERMGSPEPGVIPCVPDAIEALVSTGDTGRAEVLVADLEAHADDQRRPWARAAAEISPRHRPAARGDLDSALEAFPSALALHARAPQPFERGRTLLVKGEVERRARRKGAARESLGEAFAIFEGLGARLWAERARAALDRVGGTAIGHGGLTPTERRVAELASRGRTNREIADALFISIKTVEANLSRVFRKLGVRSRAELIRDLVAPSEHER